jgi:hypothetical protein
MKSAQTVTPEFFRILPALRPALRFERGVVVFGGDSGQRRSDVDVVPWVRLPSYDWLGE